MAADTYKNGLTDRIISRFNKFINREVLNIKCVDCMILIFKVELVLIFLKQKGFDFCC